MKRRFKQSKSNGNRINRIAKTLISFLQSQGIKVMRYDAYSTNSVYLKLDYGSLYSVRLSDHAGKKKLLYRFNAINGYVGPREQSTRWSWSREFYSLEREDLNDLCLSILMTRASKLESLGLYGYQEEMDYKRRTNAGTRGFWRQAKDLG